MAVNKKTMKHLLLLATFLTSIAAGWAASPVIAQTTTVQTGTGTNSPRTAVPGTFSRPQTTFQNPVAPTIPVTGTFSRPQSTFSGQTGTFSRPQGTFSPLETTFSRPPTTFQQALTSPAPVAAPQAAPISGAVTVSQPAVSPKVIVLDLPPGAVIRKPAAINQ
jgi:hypothetical protein